MKKRLIALCSYAFFWFVFFFFARLFFILMQFNQSRHFSLSGLSGTFLHGLKLDVSTTGYFLLIPVLLLIPSLYFSGNWYRLVIRFYTWLLIILSSLVTVADANLYSYWGFRMDSTPLLYLKTPAEAMASVSNWKVILFLVSIGLISALFIFIYDRLPDRLFRNFTRIKYLAVWIPVNLVLLGSLLIPIRGGFGVAPINAGSVYFSDKMFLNHAAINDVWNVGHSGFGKKVLKNPYVFGDSQKAGSIVDSLTVSKGTTEKVLNTSKPDIIIFVLESFSGYLIGPLGGDSLVTPNINRYAAEGILFSNFYASGTRTDKAMPAILDGYPAQPAQSIIKEPNKSQSLPSLVRILIENGYNAAFWYGGEIDFANFNSFVIGSGFHSIITKKNFNPATYNSKWGVHDHVLLQSLRDSMKSVKEPFLKVVLTLSSHEPFDVPMEPVFPGSDDFTKYRNSVYYSDKYLGAFLDWAKTTEWWKNTLIIMVADHAARFNEMPNYEPKVFRIPMIWTGGALSRHGMKVEKYAGQADIPTTVLSQLDIKGSFPFSKDILSDKSRSFAFYTYNEGFGFVTDSSAAGFDLKSRTPVLMEGRNPELAQEKGKAFLQSLFDDYIKR
jgi:phosphoglycerol transferase MdoB-like AlkP superfamily enzyme